MSTNKKIISVTTEQPLADNNIPQPGKMDVILDHVTADSGLKTAIRVLHEDIVQRHDDFFAGSTGGKKLTAPLDLSNYMKTAALEFYAAMQEIGHNTITPGGTGTNKSHSLLHTTRSLGLDSSAWIIGAYANDGELARIIETNTRNAELVMFDNGTRTDQSRASIVYTRPGNSDRDIMKLQSTVPETFKDLGYHKKVYSKALNEVGGNGLVVSLNESSAVKHLGDKDYMKLIKFLKQEGVFIATGLPTESTGIDDKMEKAIRYSVKNSQAIFCNAEELIRYTTDKSFKGEVGSKNDPMFLHAMSIAQKHMGNNKNTVLFVTNGKHNSAALQNDQFAFIDSLSVPKSCIESTLGAGDACAAATLGKMVQNVVNGFSLEERSAEAVATHIGCMNNGNHVAVATIKQPTAQISPDAIYSAVEEATSNKQSVPTTGRFITADPVNNVSQHIKKG